MFQNICVFFPHISLYYFYYIVIIITLFDGALNCNYQKVAYLLKCRICVEVSYVGEHFHKHFGKHSHNGTDDWYFILMAQCETHEQLKERETFRQHKASNALAS